MNLLRNFEQKMASIMEGSGGVSTAPISYKKLAKRAAKEMDRETLIVDGVDTAPPLYTVLVGPQDNAVMSRHYADMVAEVEEFLLEHAAAKKLVFEEDPLVRFIVDHSLKPGKFAVIAENVPPIIMAQLRREEQAFLNGRPLPRAARGYRAQVGPGIIPFDNSTSLELSQPLPSLHEQLNSMVTQQPYLGPSAGAALEPENLDEERAAYDEGAFEGDGQHASPAPEAQDAGASAPDAFFSEPAEPEGACLVCRQLDCTFPLLTNVTSIGRDEYVSDIVLSDLNVSRKHAEISFDETGWYLTDLSSTNGTFLNGQEIVTRKLRDGDLITLGITELEFREG